VENKEIDTSINYALRLGRDGENRPVMTIKKDESFVVGEAYSISPLGSDGSVTSAKAIFIALLCGLLAYMVGFLHGSATPDEYFNWTFTSLVAMATILLTLVGVYLYRKIKFFCVMKGWIEL